jgi:hypothetical protein
MMVIGAVANILIGIGIAFRKTARIALYGALLLCVIYFITSTILMSWLWLDPLGPMLKIVPIIVLNLIARAILSDR